ncbi:MAG: YggS family pyridoxal phosphate-dependent enzyme [Magnetococcales bacterium]|nr:YggS family pyridoxal phosphate-dependent enzyme [Magnetococcales bacterium]NGZ26455.1 YggS family pyridoxal phosphate-dependent enzyme [Magnetococcales bacterium]
MNIIAANLLRVQIKINQACERSGRLPSQVRLVAVSKTQPVERLAEVVDEGHFLFGENRVQEARDKIPLLANPQARFHLIGPLQRNKVKEALSLFQMIESLDSLEVAEEIERRASQPMPVLVQVNVGREAQKHGFLPEELPDTLRKLAQLSKIQVRGLMTVPPMVEEAEEARPFFRQLAELAARMNELAIPGVAMDELSMGMSHDFPVAVEEGATLVRVGSAIFGQRY